MEIHLGSPDTVTLTNWKVFRVKELYLYFMFFIAATIKLDNSLKCFLMVLEIEKVSGILNSLHHS